MSEKICLNILNKQEIQLDLDSTTTIQEIIDFLVDTCNHHFQNVPSEKIIIKQQNKQILLPNKTIQQVLSQEKSNKLFIEIDQQNELRDNFVNQQQVEFNQFSNQTQTGQSKKLQEGQPQQQIEISIRVVYQNNCFICGIDNSTTLKELLDYVKEEFEISDQEQVSLFYNNNPLQNLTQTLEELNLNNCTVEIKQIQNQGLQRFKPQNRQVSLLYNYNQLNVPKKSIQNPILLINVAYQNNVYKFEIDQNALLVELLDAVKVKFQITGQVSLFYKNNPLLNLSQIVQNINLPKNSTIEIKLNQNLGLLIQGVYQKKVYNFVIDYNATLKELLDYMKVEFEISEQEKVSLFYKNNPLLNLTQTFEELNLPQNCRIEIKQIQNSGLSIIVVYQNKVFKCEIDFEAKLVDLLNAIKEKLQVTEQDRILIKFNRNVSLFYNKDPLLNLSQTVQELNLPNNCQIHLQPAIIDQLIAQ